jgi:hypothetical protein
MEFCSVLKEMVALFAGKNGRYQVGVVFLLVAMFEGKCPIYEWTEELQYSGKC